MIQIMTLTASYRFWSKMRKLIQITRLRSNMVLYGSLVPYGCSSQWLAGWLAAAVRFAARRVVAAFATQ